MSAGGEVGDEGFAWDLTVNAGLVEGVQLDLELSPGGTGGGLTFALRTPPRAGGLAVSAGFGARYVHLSGDLGQRQGASTDDAGAFLGRGYGGLARVSVGARYDRFEWAIVPSVHGYRLSDTWYDELDAFGVGGAVFGTWWPSAVGITAGVAALKFWQSAATAEGVFRFVPFFGVAWE